MAEIRLTTWEKKPVNNGINYQPQLVIAGFQPSTVAAPPKITRYHPMTNVASDADEILRITNDSASACGLAGLQWGCPIFHPENIGFLENVGYNSVFYGVARKRTLS